MSINPINYGQATSVLALHGFEILAILCLLAEDCSRIFNTVMSTTKPYNQLLRSHAMCLTVAEIKLLLQVPYFNIKMPFYNFIYEHLCPFGLFSYPASSVPPSAHPSIHPTPTITLQPTLFEGSCSYIKQPLAFVGTLILLIIVPLCLFCRILRTLTLYRCTLVFLSPDSLPLCSLQYLLDLIHNRCSRDLSCFKKCVD